MVAPYEEQRRLRAQARAGCGSARRRGPGIGRAEHRPVAQRGCRSHSRVDRARRIPIRRPSATRMGGDHGRDAGAGRGVRAPPSEGGHPRTRRTPCRGPPRRSWRPMCRRRPSTATRWRHWPTSGTSSRLGQPRRRSADAPSTQPCARSTARMPTPWSSSSSPRMTGRRPGSRRSCKRSSDKPLTEDEDRLTWQDGNDRLQIILRSAIRGGIGARRLAPACRGATGRYSGGGGDAGWSWRC